MKARALRRSQTSSPRSSSGGGDFPAGSASPPSGSLSSLSSSWIQLRSILFVVAASSPAYCSQSSSSASGSTDRGLKSPWSRRRRKRVLSPQQWRKLFTVEGKLRDGGVRLVKKVRSGGVHPSIRAEVWPFLLGVYDLNSTKEERDNIRNQNRKEYENLRRQCKRLLRGSDESFTDADGVDLDGNIASPRSDDVVSARESLSSEGGSPDSECSDDPSIAILEADDCPRRATNADATDLNSESSDSDSSEDHEIVQDWPPSEGRQRNDVDIASKENISPFGTEVQSKTQATEGNKVTKENISPSVADIRSKLHVIEENIDNIPSEDNLAPSGADAQEKVYNTEDFATWQRIIRVDALRANPEWIPYSPSQATVSEHQARRAAQAVGLKDYDHLEPCRIFHAARLVAILEAYALHDPEIGYCQGMSDLLSPIISVITEDHEAFWCFVGFMRKARHNFRLDEVGIRRQLKIVSKIIKSKDSHLYRHLEKLQAEDCFFVYRMVVVLFRRELTFEQTLCLWEVMWADQAAIRAGIGKSAWSRIRQRAPPTDDLLLYAIAASVLQRKKLIIEKYSSMDEILRECNNMEGQLDVWKLLDDAHHLVVTLHDKIRRDKIETSS